MYEAIFYFILNMSILGSVVMVLIFLIRSIKQIPKRFICKFWLIAFARMMIPFTISSEYSFSIIQVI